MEKLTEDQRLKVMKMSDERLRRKLIQAGYKKVDILGQDRSTLMSFVARVLLAETAYVPVGTEGQTEYGDNEGDDDGEEGVAVAVGGEMQAEEINVSLEERRLMLEERKLEVQRKQREEQRMQRLLEEKRWQFEQQKWKEELALKKNEQLHRDSMAVKVKTWGDALRNILTKMPSESIEIVSWFVSVEKLFDQLKVPEELVSVDSTLFV